MKNQVVLGLALFAFAPSMVLAQTLPDEIDHVRYGASLQGLQNRLSEAEGRLGTLTSQRDSLRAQIERMETDRENLPGRNEDLLEQIAARRAQDAALDTEIRSLSATINRIGDDVRRLNQETAALQQRWTQEDARRAQLAQTLQQIEEQATGMRAILDREVGEERESAQQLNRFERQIERLSERMQELERESRELVRQNRQDERELPQRRRDQQQAQERLVALRATLAPAQETLTNARANLTQKEAALNAATTRVTPVQNRLEALRAQIGRLQSAVTVAERESTEAQNNVRALEARKTQAAASANALSGARPGLVEQVESLRASIAPAEADLATAQEKLAGDRQLYQEARDALRGGARGDIARHQIAVRAAEMKMQESQRQVEQKVQAINGARLQIAGLEAQIAQGDQQITQLNAFLGSVDEQIAAEQRKVATAAETIRSKRGEIQEIRPQAQAAEAELATVSADRDRLTPEVQQARRAVSTAEASVQQAQVGIRNQEEATAAIIKQVADMERAIAQFPEAQRRIERAGREAQDELRDRRRDAEREQRLLVRISDNRIRLQRELSQLEGQGSNVARDLQQQTALAAQLANDFNAKETQRVQLQNYASESRTQLDAKVATQADLRQANADAERELGLNRERLVQIGREIGPAQGRLVQAQREVDGAQSVATALEGQVAQADEEYRERLSLYRSHLQAAQQLGQGRAAAQGQQDGRALGQTSALETAQRLGAQSGGQEGRWEALLRGFVRGEVAGFNAGKAEGLASDADSARGIQEGTALGQREARDQADQVLKPRFYGEAFTARLADSDPAEGERVRVRAAAPKRFSSNRGETVPALTAAELSESRALVTPLDNRIQEALAALENLRRDQQGMRVPTNSYQAPAAVNVAVNAATCQGVYKNVAAYVTACQESYRGQYRGSFLQNHRDTFLAGFPAAIESELGAARSAAINSEFTPRFAEAQGVARVIGLAEGKEEVYRVRFAEARAAAYQRALPVEEQRARGEATQMVTAHFNTNGVAALSGSGIFSTAARFGVAAGNTFKLKLPLKNAGARDLAEGAVQVRLIETSPNLTTQRGQAPVPVLAANSAGQVEIDFGLRANDAAVAGERARVLAEITYPGNDYVARRVERVEILENLGVNPTVISTVNFDSTPDVRGVFGGTNVHEVAVTLNAKHNGSGRGHRVTLEEVVTGNTRYATFDVATVQFQPLEAGRAIRGTLKYKLNRTAERRNLSLKVKVFFNQELLEEKVLNIRGQ